MPVIKSPETTIITDGYMTGILEYRNVLRNAADVLTNGELHKGIYCPPVSGEGQGTYTSINYDPPEFDTIVGIGLSGTLLIEHLAMSLKCNWLALRKRNDGSHSTKLGEGKIGHKWLFVDDFIGSGQTLQNVCLIMEDLCDDYEIKTEWVGCFLYNASQHLETPESLLQRNFSNARENIFRKAAGMPLKDVAPDTDFDKLYKSVDDKLVRALKDQNVRPM